MVRRVTVSLDDNLESKIREIQVQIMTEKNRSVSFSKVLNQLLKEGLDNYKPIMEFQLS